MRGRLSIGIHRDVEVTEAAGAQRRLVSQAFCSALPVAYTRLPATSPWKPFASLVLEAAYEATMWSAVLNAQRGALHIVRHWAHASRRMAPEGAMPLSMRRSVVFSSHALVGGFRQ